MVSAFFKPTLLNPLINDNKAPLPGWSVGGFEVAGFVVVCDGGGGGGEGTNGEVVDVGAPKIYSC